MRTNYAKSRRHATIFPHTTIIQNVIWGSHFFILCMIGQILTSLGDADEGWCGVGGRGAKNTLGFAWGACWILVPYASVSGKTVFKFRFDVFSVGSQNLNIMCQGQKS